MHLELHLTVFNVVGRLALIEDAEGAIEGDGAEFLSSLDQGAGPHWHTHTDIHRQTQTHATIKLWLTKTLRTTRGEIVA